MNKSEGRQSDTESIAESISDSALRASIDKLDLAEFPEAHSQPFKLLRQGPMSRLAHISTSKGYYPTLSQELKT